MSQTNKRQVRTMKVIKVMKVMTLIISIALLSSVFGYSPAPVSNGIATEAKALSVDGSVYDVEIGYGLNESFSGALDWHVMKGHPSCIVKITDGELELSSYGIQTQAAWHELNLSKQDYTISFNYRLADDLGPPPHIGNLFGVLYLVGLDWPVSITGGVYERVPLAIFQMLNRSLHIEHDDGTRTYVPTVIHTETPALGFDYNYQITVNVWGWNDTARVSVYNKSASSYLFQSAEFATYRTHADYWTPCPVPDRIYVGDGAGWGAGTWFHAFWDNFTITFSRADHTGTTLNSYGVDQTIKAFADKLTAIEYESGKWSLGYDPRDVDWETSPLYYLEADNIENSRDDVVGEAIELLCMLYEYYGDENYLDQAKAMWDALLTHRHVDGGWTFGLENADYVDTDARVVLGLLALYRTTGNTSYLDAVEITIAAMYAYQDLTTGHVFGRYDRGIPLYRFDNESWAAAFFAVALLEAYKYIPNTAYLTKAELALSWLIMCQADSGRQVSAPAGATSNSPDWGDTVNTGCTLWALSLGYKMTENAEYLHHAHLAARYVVDSEYTKGSISSGLWSGFIKERYNQSDLTYSWPVLAGLASYRTIMSDDNGDAELSLYAAINRLSLIQGSTANVTGEPLYGLSGVWAGSWNVNNSDAQGWTPGWFCEGGWGTWGYTVFYGWQSCIVKAMIDVLADANETALYVRSGAVISSSGNVANADLTGSYDRVNLTVDPAARTFVLVKEYASGDTLLSLNISTTTGTALFDLEGVDPSITYSMLVDGIMTDSLLSAPSSGILEFSYSGPWSSHEVLLEVSAMQKVINIVYPFIGLVFVMGIIGMMTALFVGGKKK